MKVEKIDHVHVFVKDLDKAIAFFSDILGTKFSGPIDIEEAVNVRCYLEPMGVELVASTTPDGVVARTIEKRGEGLAAISFKVPNLDEAVAELQAKGLRLLGWVQVGNLREAQFHPKDAYGVTIELCEYEARQGALAAGLEARSTSSPTKTKR